MLIARVRVGVKTAFLAESSVRLSALSCCPCWCQNGVFRKISCPRWRQNGVFRRISCPRWWQNGDFRRISCPLWWQMMFLSELVSALVSKWCPPTHNFCPFRVAPRSGDLYRQMWDSPVFSRAPHPHPACRPLDRRESVSLSRNLQSKLFLGSPKSRKAECPTEITSLWFRNVTLRYGIFSDLSLRWDIGRHLKLPVRIETIRHHAFIPPKIAKFSRLRRAFPL